MFVSPEIIEDISNGKYRYSVLKLYMIGSTLFLSFPISTTSRIKKLNLLKKY